jgi:hypothetical protein
LRITVTVPDELVAHLLPAGQDPASADLEALAIAVYRQRRPTGYQFRSLLGVPSRYELDGILKKHRVEKYTAEDFEHDLATLRETEEKTDHLE